MDSTQLYFDPLCFDLVDALNAFSTWISNQNVQIQAHAAVKKFHVARASSTTSAMLDQLSSMLRCQEFTAQIQLLFRPLAVDLVARWLSNVQNRFGVASLDIADAPVDHMSETERAAQAFATLLPTSPQLKSYVGLCVA
jgi:type II secretory pathway component PulM